MTSDTSVSRPSAVWTALSVGLLLLWVALNLAADGPLTGDDHYALWSAHAMWMGERPNRDFFDPGSPLLTLISYVGQLASGHRPLAELLISTAFRALGVVFVYRLTLRATARAWVALIVATLVALLAFPSGVYGAERLVLYPLAVLAAWRYLDGQGATANGNARGQVLLASIAALAFLTRHDHGLYVGASLLLTIVLARRSPLPFIAMTVAFLLPWLLWVQWNEGLVTYFTTRVSFAFSLGLGKTRPGFGFAAGGPLLPENVLHFLWQLAILTTWAALAVAIRLRDRRVLILAVAAVLMQAGIMRELDLYPDAAALWLPLAAWLACRARRPVLIAAAATLALATGGAVVIATGSAEQLPRVVFDGGGLFARISSAFVIHSTLPPIDVYAPPGSMDDRLIVRYVHDCLDADDRVWETSDWFSLPYQSGRRLVEHPYWSLGFRRELDATFAAALPARGMPPLIVVRDIEDPLDAFAYYPDTRALVKREYEPVTSPRFEQFRADVENVQLLRYRGRTPTGVFAPLDLPCFRQESR